MKEKIDWGPGYRLFKCEICGHKWKEKSRDCTSPSSSICPNFNDNIEKHDFNGHVVPYDYEKHYEWETDGFGNLIKDTQCL